MDRDYIISNICDHFAFEENVDDARNRAVDFVVDYFRKYGLNSDALSNLICAVNSLWLFCKNEKNRE